MSADCKKHYVRTHISKTHLPQTKRKTARTVSRLAKICVRLVNIVGGIKLLFPKYI